MFFSQAQKKLKKLRTLILLHRMVSFNILAEKENDMGTEQILAARLRLMEYSLKHSLDDLLQKTLDEAESLTGSLVGFYHFVDMDQQVLTMQAWSTRTSTQFCKTEGTGWHYGISQAGVWADCIHERRPVIHNDYASLPNRKGLPEGHAAVIRELVVPVFRNEKIVAIIGVGNKPADYDQRDVEAITLLADLAYDIAEQKLALETLRESEERYHTFYDTSPDAILITVPDGNILAANPAACRMFQRTEEEIRQIGRSGVMDVTDERLAMAIEERKKTGKVSAELTCVRKNGERFPVELNSSVFKAISGNYRSSIVIRDISERKKAEAEKAELGKQLQQSQKLESLGLLAGGIAHDFNNILAIIIGNCFLAKTHPEVAAKHIAPIENAAERAAELCRQMLAYAGKTTYVLSSFNLQELVQEMAKMLRATTSPNVLIKSNFSTDLPVIKADASQLRQVIMNLIINATEAIGDEQGEIDISIYRSKIDPAQVQKDHLGKPIAAGEYVCLEVTDNGCGMDEEVRNRIFEPFFTTKFTGRGLGMSSVLGIIAAHNGAIQLESSPGQGSCFKIYLPVQVNAVAETDLTESAPLPLWQGHGTVLLAEDEDALRLIVKSMLKRLGFAVLEAVDGLEALKLYHEHAAAVTMVLTDIGMPVMDGYQLIAELKRLNPELPIVVSSGFGDTVISERVDNNELSGLISKPYRFDQLKDVLKSVQDAMKNKILSS